MIKGVNNLVGKKSGLLRVLIGILCVLQYNTQGQIQEIGGWRDHLPLGKCMAIAESDTDVLGLSEHGILRYNKTTNSIDYLSKVTGLSDIGLKSISYDALNNQFIIGYTNGNIDVLRNDAVININDIKRSTIMGNKSISSIYISGQYAYLCCGFGIVAMSLDKLLLMETYYIGAGNAFVNTKDISIFHDSMFVATDEGVFVGSKIPSTQHYTGWKKINAPQSGITNISCIESTGTNLYINYSSEQMDADTIYRYNSGAWEKVTLINPSRNMSMHYKNGVIVIAHEWITTLYNENLEFIRTVYNSKPYNPVNAIIGNNNVVWIADYLSGLVKSPGGFGTEFISANRRSELSTYSLTIDNDKTFALTGLRSNTNGNNSFFTKGICILDNEDWTKLNRDNSPEMSKIFDVLYLVPGSKDDQYFFSSLGNGIAEINGGVITKVYDSTNSTIEAPINWHGYFGISGLANDENGNLWALNSRVPEILKMKSKDNQWYSFSVASLAGNLFLENLIISNEGHLWISAPFTGIAVYDPGGSAVSKSDDRSILLSSGVGKGNLHSLAGLCMAKDLDGKIWVGTGEGVVVFNNTGGVFSGSGFDAEKILIKKDTYYQYLLETEVISSIVVDGANRKWVGTRGSGLYLISPDGTSEIQHFTEENSPMPSNFITALSINPKNGELFIGTEQGLMSYRTDAIEGREDYSFVKCFPNPVESGYSGPIAISGLIAESNIKITDISGRLVFETTSLGGQAIWNGNDLNGERVNSGVYMVFGASPEGDEKMVSKILFFR